MSPSQIPNNKEKLIATERALDELWAQVRVSGQSSEERGQMFAEIARLEQFADDLKQMIAVDLTDI